MIDFKKQGLLLTGTTPKDAATDGPSDLQRQLTGGRLTTIDVIYYMPAHPSLLQEFIWQTLDLAPDFPRMHRFLDFWRREIDAVIHSVSIGGVGQVQPSRIKTAHYVGSLVAKNLQ